MTKPVQTDQLCGFLQLWLALDRLHNIYIFSVWLRLVETFVTYCYKSFYQT